MTSRMVNRVGGLVSVLLLIGLGNWAYAQAPVTDFSANNASGCSPLTVSFTDLSSNSPNQWSWDFGNSNNSILQNPSAVYTNPGTYTVTLTATNGGGSDTEVKVAYITVFQSPVASFVGDTVYGCNPLPVQFTDQSVPGSGAINSWIWDFGDGNVSTLQSPSHQFILNGGFSVSLTTTDDNGCQNTSFVNNFVNLSNPGTAAISGGPIDTCVFPVNIPFNDQSTAGSAPIVNWSWDFGDGSGLNPSQNPSHLYTSAGSYDVTLIVSDSLACPDTIVLVDYINIIDFQADFVIDTLSSCPNFVLVFYDSTSPGPVSWQWDFGDGNGAVIQNPLYFYDTSGTYDVTLVVENAIGCKDSITQTVVFNKPFASFTVDTTQTCETPLLVTFASSISGTAPLSYDWNFDNGTPNSNLANPTHNYTTAGIFNPYLVVIDGLGCTDTFYMGDIPDSIMIVPPTAHFTMDPEAGGCVPLTVNFTDSSYSAISNVNSWSWDFGDPASGGSNTSTSQNPVHTFNAAGIYNVQLTIVTDWGCTNTVIINVPVGITPTLVDFLMSDTIVCHNDVVQFTDLSTDSINNWLWWFGDSTIYTTAQNPSHAFADTGSMTITLIAGHNGCNDTMEQTLIVVPPKTVFTVTPTIGCTAPHVATFSDFSIGADTWFWDFGDGFSSTDTNTTHTYTAPGSYTVKLLITNLNGCADSGFAAVVIPDLQADFTTPDTVGCFTLNSDFTNTSTWLYTPAITFNLWNYGDGTINGTTYPSQFNHPYTDTGLYTVALTITDFYGCTSTMIKTDYISVNGVYPGLSSSQTVGCAPLTVAFSDTSTGSLPIESWSWNFLDGSPMDTTQNPTHIYTVDGTFSVTLAVADSNGCTNSITYVNLINSSRPSPSFSYLSPICIGGDLGIQDSSWGDGISYLWDFGDGNTDTVPNPLHGYADTGLYILTLIVTDSNSCDSSLVSIVDVSPSSSANFVVDTINTNCPPLVVSFQDSSSLDVVSWFWDFGDGATSANQNPIHTYSYPDTFDVMLAVANGTGCVDTLTFPGLIQIGGPYGSFTFLPDSGCTPLDVTFEANGINTTIYIWDFGDGVIDSLSGDSLVHTYMSEGTPHPFLILSDSLGCQQPAQPPDPDSILIDNPSALFGSSTILLYTTLCGLDTVYFYDSSSVESSFTSITTWNWDFGDGGTDTATNPYHVYNDTGSYTVVLEVSNSLGCIKYDTMLITVVLDSFNILKASIPLFTDVGCGGDNTGDATGLAQGGTTPYSYYWSDDSSQTTVQSTGLIAGIYWLIITDSNGCTATDSVVISEPPPLVATIFDSTMITCYGAADGTAEAMGTGGSGTYTYVWDDPGTQSTAQAVNLDVDTFTVTITDSIGCIAKDSLIMLQPAVLIADSGLQLNVSCLGGNNGYAAVTVSGGTAPYTYSWNTTPIQTDTFIDSLSADIYTIAVEDSFACMANYTFTITEPTLLYALVIQKIDIECFNDTTGEAFLQVFGGVPNYSINWQSVNDTGKTVDSLWAGWHIYDLTDAAGCVYVDSVNMVQPDEILITTKVGDGTICRYGTDSVQAIAYGGVAPLSYVWSSPLGTGTGWQSDSPDSTTTYQLTVTDANNCIAKDSVQVIVYELISVAVSADTLCVGDSNALEVYITSGMDSTYSYVWDFGDGVVDTTGDTSASHTYTVVGNDLIDLTVLGPDLCVTDSLKFDTLTILGSPIAGFTANPTTTNTTSPIVSFTDVSQGGVVTGENLVGWYWDFGDGDTSGLEDPSHYYRDSGTYNVMLAIINEQNCTDTISLNIRIDPSFEIEVPNAFTPDPNGANGGIYDPEALDNNIFYPVTKFVEEFHMIIFNRWGEMVFESFELAIGWDGYYRGVLSQQDVYVWKIDLRYINGDEFNQIGDVTLVR